MTAPQSPTPNDMPGAAPQQPTLNPQLQNPVSTGTPPPPAPPAQQQQPPAPAATPPAPPAPPQQSDPAGNPPMTAEAWREIARKNEERAKENVEKAKQWDEYQATLRSKEEQQAIDIAQRDARIKELETQALQEKIARETGVLPQFLGSGTEEQMRAAAKAALDWRGPQGTTPPAPPPPQTAAVPASTVTAADSIGTSPNGVQQLTREQFVALPPAQRMEAVRAGQCTNLGIGKPQQQRRMGNEVELGAHMSAQR